MLVTNSNHIFLLDNGEGFSLVIILGNVGHLGKVLR